jgi:hypothetical protein
MFVGTWTRKGWDCLCVFVYLVCVFVYMRGRGGIVCVCLFTWCVFVYMRVS